MMRTQQGKGREMGAIETVEPRTLEHRRRELVRRHEQATERVALFPNPVNQRQLTELASEIDAIDERIRDLRG